MTDSFAPKELNSQEQQYLALVDKLQINLQSDVINSSLKNIKNLVIGDKKKKTFFIQEGCIPKIFQLTKVQDGQEFMIQAVSLLGSFAYQNCEGQNQILEHNGVNYLVYTCLSKTQYPKVVAVALRSLKILCTTQNEQLFNQIKETKLHYILDELLEFKFGDIPSLSAQIIALLSQDKIIQQELIQIHCIDKLFSLILEKSQQCMLSGLRALNGLISENANGCRYVVKKEKLVKFLVSLLRSTNSEIQLQGAASLASITTYTELPEGMQDVQDIRQSVLLALTMLLELPNTKSKVPLILAQFLRQKSYLQKQAGEGETIKILAKLLLETKEKNGFNQNTKFRAHLLQAVGVICDQAQKNRKIVTAETNALTQIILQSLKDSDRDVRYGALLCIKSFSKDHEDIKVFEESISQTVFQLLNDYDKRIQILALQTISNCVLYGGGIAHMVKQSKYLKDIVKYIHNDNKVICNSSIRCLYNWLTSTDLSVKDIFTEHVQWQQIKNLLSVNDIDIQTATLTVLQNLICKNKHAQFQNAFNWSNGELIGQVMKFTDRSLYDELIVTQALNVVANYLLWNLEVRNSLILDSEYLTSTIAKILNDEEASEELWLACLWVIINSTIKDDEEQGALNEYNYKRVQKFKDNGILPSLNMIKIRASLNVQERAQTVTEQFEKVDQQYDSAIIGSSNQHDRSGDTINNVPSQARSMDTSNINTGNVNEAEMGEGMDGNPPQQEIGPQRAIMRRRSRSDNEQRRQDRRP